MKKCLLTLSLVAASAQVAQAAPLAVFDMDETLAINNGTASMEVQPVTTGADVSLTNITNGGGLGGADFWMWNVSTSDTLVATPTVAATSSDTSNADDAIAGNAFFSFTLTADPGKTLDLDELSFRVARGNTSGNRNWAVRSDASGTTNLASNFTNDTTTDIASAAALQTVDLTGAQFQGLNAIVFTFFQVTDSTFRTVVWDDIAVTGDAVPEPASLALVGLGGLLMLGRSRRR